MHFTKHQYIQYLNLKIVPKTKNNTKKSTYKQTNQHPTKTTTTTKPQTQSSKHNDILENSIPFPSYVKYFVLNRKYLSLLHCFALKNHLT
jgi:hypothetical protein